MRVRSELYPGRFRHSGMASPRRIDSPNTIGLDLIVNSGAHVPHLWRIEVANGLSMGVRRKRISGGERDKALQDLLGLPIFDDLEGQLYVWHQTMQISDRYNLTVYDGTYLELALRLSLPLATLDRELRLAAQAERVTLLGL